MVEGISLIDKIEKRSRKIPSETIRKLHDWICNNLKTVNSPFMRDHIVSKAQKLPI